MITIISRATAKVATRSWLLWCSALTALGVGLAFALTPLEYHPSIGPQSRIVVPKTLDAPEGSERTPARQSASADSVDSALVGWTIMSADSIQPERLPARSLELSDSVLVAPAAELWAREPGDPIVLTIPQVGVTYSTVIDRIETGVAGAQSYVGRLEPGNLPYSFVITVGERSVFASLGTSHGPFELVGNRELAWLTPGSSYDELFDYTKDDYEVHRDEGIRELRRVAR